jgi:glycogen(starch) synthase
VRCYTTMEICAVLDGYLDSSRTGRLLCDLERHALRNADRVLAPGGDVAASYRRFYREEAIAPTLEVHHPVTPGASASQPPEAEDGLRLLYVGRLERRKGVQNLIRAAAATPGTDWTLTLVGSDTPTAPLGLSMRDQLELMTAGDQRIRLAGQVSREELRELIARSHALVSPSLWECWPNTVLEAFEQNRPVLATPVGGHTGMVADGAGWLFDGTAADAIAAGLERLIARREEVTARIESGGPRAAFERLTDPAPVRERYLELCRERPRGRRVPRPGDGVPLVSVIVPYFHMHDHVAETIESIFTQTHRPLEVIVVNDGSFEPADYVLAELAERFPLKVVTQPNSGLGQARNLGVAVSRGRYVVPVDPDDLLLPEFVARCVEVLEAEPELAYATTWTTYMDEDGTPIPGGGYRPLGNTAGYLDTENVAGSAMALIRRSVFSSGHRYSADLTSYEDWLLYRELAAAGLEGRVIPEPLARYRVRRRSMMRTIAQPRLERLHGELSAHLRESEIAWTSSNA